VPYSNWPTTDESAIEHGESCKASWARSLDARSFVQAAPDSWLEPVLKTLHKALAPIVDKIEKRPLN
jgi:hypothetical protein